MGLRSSRTISLFKLLLVQTSLRTPSVWNQMLLGNISKTVISISWWVSLLPRTGPTHLSIHCRGCLFFPREEELSSSFHPSIAPLKSGCYIFRIPFLFNMFLSCEAQQSSSSPRAPRRSATAWRTGNSSVSWEGRRCRCCGSWCAEPGTGARTSGGCRSSGRKQPRCWQRREWKC